MEETNLLQILELIVIDVDAFLLGIEHVFYTRLKFLLQVKRHFDVLVEDAFLIEMFGHILGCRCKHALEHRTDSLVAILLHCFHQVHHLLDIQDGIAHHFVGAQICYDLLDFWVVLVNNTHHYQGYQSSLPYGYVGMILGELIEQDGLATFVKLDGTEHDASHQQLLGIGIYHL